MQDVMTRITDSRLRKAVEIDQRMMINTAEIRMKTLRTGDVDSDQLNEGE
jgi:hypothetical protein